MSTREGAWSPRPLDKGGGAVSKKIFSALRASVWSKNEGGGGVAPRPSPLDPPLSTTTLV